MMFYKKEWVVEATIEIQTSLFCYTKEDAEEEAHQYLSELCANLYPDCCLDSYEIENIFEVSQVRKGGDAYEGPQHN